jgi:hypothetical protein
MGASDSAIPLLGFYGRAEGSMCGSHPNDGALSLVECLSLHTASVVGIVKYQEPEKASCPRKPEEII